MKKVIGVILLIIFSLFVFCKLSLVFVRKGNGYGTDVLNFYKQKKNTIDVIGLGSSHTYTSLNPNIFYENSKLNLYNFATQQQPTWITYYYLREALKYQTPKYAIFDVHMPIVESNNYASESVNRDALDKMRMSKNKIEAINTSVEKISDRYSYYVNIIKYHTRYKELTKGDIGTAFFGKTVDNLGYIGLQNSGYVFDGVSYNNQKLAINKKSEEYLIKIIELCKENNVKLILIKTPCIYDSFSVAKLNYIEDIAKEKDVIFLNYVKDISNLNLNYKADFYDSGHLSVSGSQKLSFDITNIINSMEVHND